MAVSLFNTNNSAELQVLPELEFSFNTLPQTLTGSLLKFVSDYNVGVSLLETSFYLKMYDRNDIAQDKNISPVSLNIPKI